jgi:hypothetical protein
MPINSAVMRNKRLYEKGRIPHFNVQTSLLVAWLSGKPMADTGISLSN